MKKFLLALAAGCVLTFSAFVLFSCQVSSIGSDNKPETTYLVVRLSDSLARSVYPTLDTDLSDYKFTLLGEINSESKTIFDNVTLANLSNPVSLSAGVWNFELQASKDGTLYKATVNEFELVSGTNTVTFALNLVENHYEGNGEISLTLTYEDGSNKASSATVLIDDVTSDLALITDTAVTINGSITAGSHNVKVLLYDDKGTLLGSYQDTWYFYGGKTTASLGVMNLPFFPEPDPTLTAVITVNNPNWVSDPVTVTPAAVEPIYSEFISTKTPEDLYGFNTETKLPFGRYQFRGAYATEWSGTYSNYFYDAEFASDGTTITLDGQVFNVVEIKEYWTNSSTAYFMGAVLLNKANTYLCYKYQFYYGTETAPKGYVNMFRTKDEFTGTTLPSSAPTFASSKRTYYSDINYSVLYPELSIRFDARHSSVDGMSYRWVDTATSTQYIIDFQTHFTSAIPDVETLDIPVSGSSARKEIVSPLYEQFCTMNNRPHEGEGDFADSVDDGEIMYGELIFYLDENGKRHLLFSTAVSDKTNQKPIYDVKDWLISEDAFNEVMKNFN